jgi:cytochrome c peroxidase
MIDGGFHNNALDDGTNFVYADNGVGGISGNQFDNGVFKTPHIRNIEVTGPYMHDGRFLTLEEVVHFYNDSLHNPPNADVNMKFAAQGGLDSLSAQDKADLIAFLKTLTDHKFLTNPKYSNPF